MHVESELDRANAIEPRKRRHARYLYSAPIELRRVDQTTERISHGMTLDISEGGFGAVLEERIQPGETVRVDMPLPKVFLQALAIVRYAGSKRSGFEFLNLNADSRRELRAAGEMYAI